MLISDQVVPHRIGPFNTSISSSWIPQTEFQCTITVYRAPWAATDYDSMEGINRGIIERGSVSIY